jgi:DNA-binding NarL/FixJ family response regulator
VFECGFAKWRCESLTVMSRNSHLRTLQSDHREGHHGSVLVVDAKPVNTKKGQSARASTATLSILLVDDYAIVRRGLRALLESQQGWSVVAEASNGREAVSLATQLRPDITILDLCMPQLNGLDACRLILKAVPEARVLVLTAYSAEDAIEKALQAGVRGYVLKTEAEIDLVNAVKALMDGRTFFTRIASDVLVEHLRREREGGWHPALTTREAQIVQLLAEGKGNKEVAYILGISPRTVENHRAQIMDRLGLHSFSELIRYAVRNGMVEA